ncbi:MAG: hypothetical protein V4739_06980 [Pseudomonadota bacterium]
MSNRFNDQQIFDHTIQAIEADVAALGIHMAVDSTARLTYMRQIKAMSDELSAEAKAGRITWAQAAAEAQEARNAIMEITRSRTTPVARALAESLKAEGKTLAELLAGRTVTMYGKDARFELLSPMQQNAVYAEIVKSAGKSNPKVTGTMMKLRHAGRGLIFLSLAISVYEIAEAEDKVDAAKKEGAIAGAGVAGSVVSGALAGLVCGPGAPVCVTLGAFIGGSLAAFGMSMIW